MDIYLLRIERIALYLGKGHKFTRNDIVLRFMENQIFSTLERWKIFAEATLRKKFCFNS